jgi:FkbM family methyltransferase
MNFYLHRLLFKIGLFKKLNIQTSKVINGKKFELPVIYEAGYHNMIETEEWLIKLLEDLLKIKEGILIDVGMNIGQTLLKFASINNGRNYIGFEPNPIAFFVCQKVVRLNHLHSFNLFPIGLFDKTEMLTLYLDKDYASGASLLRKFRKNISRYNQQINVAVFKGDELQAINNEETIAIIKADVEGAELEVIKGLSFTINRTKPFIILEILPVYNLNEETGLYRKQRENELLSVLKQMDYKMYLIDENGHKLISIAEISVHSSMSKTNYLFVPDQQMNLIYQMKHYKIQESN